MATKQVYAEPTNIALGVGASEKFRLKNPNKEKYIYNVALSDPSSYVINIPPYEVVPMGENIPVEITRTAAGGPCTVNFKIFKFLPQFPHFEIAELGQPIFTFALTVNPK